MSVKFRAYQPEYGLEGLSITPNINGSCEPTISTKTSGGTSPFEILSGKNEILVRVVTGKAVVGLVFTKHPILGWYVSDCAPYVRKFLSGATHDKFLEWIKKTGATWQWHEIL